MGTVMATNNQTYHSKQRQSVLLHPSQHSSCRHMPTRNVHDKKHRNASSPVTPTGGLHEWHKRRRRPQRHTEGQTGGEGGEANLELLGGRRGAVGKLDVNLKPLHLRVRVLVVGQGHRVGYLNRFCIENTNVQLVIGPKTIEGKWKNSKRARKMTKATKPRRKPKKNQTQGVKWKTDLPSPSAGR